NDTLPTLGNLTTWVIPSGGDPSASCTIMNGTALHCPFGDMANNSSRTVIVQTAAAADVTGCGLLKNTATITGTGLPTKSDMGDQSCSDYSIVKTPDAGTYKIGDTPSFTMLVTATAGTPKNVMLTDTLPTLGTLTAWVIAPGGDPSGTCTITG